MAKKEKTVEGTVCKPFLHEGKGIDRGEDLELPVSTARMLENSQRFTTDDDERARVKRAARSAARSSRPSGSDSKRVKDAEKAAEAALELAAEAEARATAAEETATSSPAS